jgi:hypothetical protein
MKDLDFAIVLENLYDVNLHQLFYGNIEDLDFAIVLENLHNINLHQI